jgi:hypothetical protein
LVARPVIEGALGKWIGTFFYSCLGRLCILFFGSVEWCCCPPRPSERRGGRLKPW